MRSLALATAVLACINLGITVTAHSTHEGIVVPKLFGRRALADLHARGAFGRQRRAVPDENTSPVEGPVLNKRQSTTTCGSNNGGAKCAAGLCCSAAGYCGTGSDFCTSPGCQLTYGPACDGNQIPAGSTTSTVARPVLGSQPYGGAGVYDCLTAGTIALTFDDGPYIYTAHILDLLKQYGARATFFITGNNNGKGALDNTALPWAALVKRMIAEGHQVASHTWSHEDLSLVTRPQRLNQMYYNEMAFRNILGYFPTYMRPPYSSCNAACQTDMKTLGYHITYFDVDTDDYDNDSATLIVNAENNFDKSVNGVSPATNDFLVIAHDIHQYTAQTLVEFMLKRIASNGYQGVTVGECLGDPKANWYRTAGGAGTSSSAVSSSTASTSTSKTSSSASSTSTAPTPTGTLAVSTDGSCGANSPGPYTCKGSTFGSSCSQYGWCGAQSDTNYSGTGCQASYGLCGLPGTSTTASTSATTTKSTSTSATATSTKPSSSLTASTTSTSTAPTASSTLIISPDATCGTQSGGKYTCKGSAYGDSCSVNGWCGPITNSAYSGTGCQIKYGSCA